MESNWQLAVSDWLEQVPNLKLDSSNIAETKFNEVNCQIAKL